MTSTSSNSVGTVWVDAALIRNWILEQGSTSLLDLLKGFQQKGYEIHTTNVIEQELRWPDGTESPESKAWSKFKADNPGVVQVDTPVFEFDPSDRNSGEKSIKAAIEQGFGGSDATIFSDDAFRGVDLIDERTGEPIKTAKTGDIIRRAATEGVISNVEAAAIRDTATGLLNRNGQQLYGNYPGSIAENTDKKGWQNMPTNEQLNVERGYQTSPSEPGKSVYWDKSRPRPSGFRTDAENLALSNEPANIKASKAAVADEISKLLRDPASYAGEALRPEIASKINLLGKGLIAVGIAATLYDMASTAAKIQALRDSGQYAQANIEAAALIGRQEGAWIFGLAGGSVGADVGAVVGGILGAFVGPEGIPVGAAIGSVVGGLVGGVVAAIGGYEYGDQIGRFLGDVYNQAANLWNDIVRDFDFPWPNNPDGSPSLPWDPNSPFNPNNWFPPDSPFNPNNWFPPDSPWNPNNWRDPQNPLNPNNWLPNLFGPSFMRRDPLVLDLNGDGVHLTSLSGSSSHFDLNGDGFAEKTGWISAGDAFLVLDRNGNGQIDNGNEFFGSSTRDGFTALRDLDSNADGFITSADAQFGSLRLWIDANRDGLSQANEIVTLSSKSIASINLTATRAGWEDNGNDVLYQGGFSLTDGTQQQVVAVDFATDQVHTVFNLPDGFIYDPEVFTLPNLHGYGRVPDLWTAMSLDPELKQMVKEFIAGGLSAIDESYGRPYVHTVSVTGTGGTPGGSTVEYRYEASAFEDILARWAGVAISEGDNDVAQIQATAEAFMNRATLVGAGGDNPNFQLLFQKFAANEAVRFFVQTAALIMSRGTSLHFETDGSLTIGQATLPANLVPFAGMVFDPRTDSISGNAAALIDSELSDLSFDPANPWDGYTQWVAEHKIVLDIVDPTGAMLKERHRARTGNQALDILLVAHAEHQGTSGADTLIGDVGGSTADLLEGKAGNDHLEGGTGNDTYVFTDGFGSDVVLDSAGAIDEIAFQGTLTYDRVHFAYANGNRQDLLITFDGSADQITVLGYFLPSGNGTIEKITFPDGSVASARRVVDDVLASVSGDGADILRSYDIGSTLLGKGGNDDLRGRGANDVLDGGVGDDTLSGGGGDDIYRFRRGDGQDIITDYSGEGSWGGTDTIQLQEGITLGDVTVTQVNGGNDLLLTIAGGDSITLRGTITNSDNRIERVTFANGTVWSHAQLMTMATAPTDGADVFYGSYNAESILGGAGNDTIYGRDGNDIITGGAGNDQLSGDGGNDTYVFALGDGQDTILDYSGKGGWGGTDTVQFQEGIAPGDVTVTQVNGGNDLLLTIAGGDSITLRGTITNGDNRIEQVTFADGTVWNHAQLMTQATAPTDNADVFYGSYDAEALAGGAGNDTIYGRDGNDIITGGAGNDQLSGDGGNDIYVFARGDGQDVITDYSGKGGWGGIDTVQFLEGIAPGDVTVTQVNGGNDLLLTIAGGDSITLRGTVTNSDNRIEQVTFADGTVWTAAQLLEKSSGATAGNDVLYGSYNAEAISGGAGNDTIYGREGNDIITGGTGNDQLSGDGGNDIYVFALGDGQDTILDYSGKGGWGGNDTVQFLEGIAPGDVTVTQVNGGNDLLLTIAGGDSITLRGTITNSDNRIERVTFANGTVWSHAQLMTQATAPTDGADVFYGSYNAEAISGGAGNDTIYGRDGNDIITGGTGNDQLSGDGGNDTYVFARGDGQDTILDYSGKGGWGGTDTVQFLEGIAPGDVTVTQVNGGNDLLLTIAGGDSITLRGTITNGDNRIEQVTFADGTIWDHAQLMTLATTPTDNADVFYGSYNAEAISGGAGNDTIYGRDGNDIITGGTGNDQLSGDGGNDTYVFARGDGQDAILDYSGKGGWGGNDTVQFLEGIAPGDVTVTQVNGGNDLLLTIAGGDSITLRGTITNGDNRIEQVTFADGTIWNHAQLMTLATTPTDNADVFYGSYNAEAISGGAGNDAIYGRDGNDIITGGTGNDQLSGDGGNDTYVFARGDGQDTILDYSGKGGWGGIDTVQFLEGIAPEDVTVTQVNGGNDLLLTIAGGDSITLRGTVTNSDNRIEQVTFANGTVWSHAQLILNASATGGAGAGQNKTANSSSVSLADAVNADFASNQMTIGERPKSLNGEMSSAAELPNKSNIDQIVAGMVQAMCAFGAETGSGLSGQYYDAPKPVDFYA